MRTSVWIVIVCATALVVCYLMYLGRKRTPLQIAQDAHHAEPPLGQTALQNYEKSMQTAPNTTAMLEMATIYDHGIYQGDEPVMPAQAQAIELYRRVEVAGAPVERQLARERIVEIARDRFFVNPAPRRQHVPDDVPDDVPRTDVEIIDNVNRLPRSDSQNVHDSSVVKSVKASLEKLGPSGLSMEQTLVTVRVALGENEDALKGLDLMETNTLPVSSLEMREVDVLRRVWGRIDAESDPVQKEKMCEMLVDRLAECGKEASCATGRVARVVDALATFDERVQLRPLWALRQEMLAKASLLQAEESDIPLGKRLQDTFQKEYVETGLMTLEVMNAELASWGDM